MTANFHSAQHAQSALFGLPPSFPSHLYPNQSLSFHYSHDALPAASFIPSATTAAAAAKNSKKRKSPPPPPVSVSPSPVSAESEFPMQSKRVLSSHVSSLLPLECPFDSVNCQRRFANDLALHRHAVTHHGIHYCAHQSCGTHIAFKDSLSLQRHFTVHRALPPLPSMSFECFLCGNLFSDRKEWENSSNRDSCYNAHSMGKPFLCDFPSCGFGFSRLSYLRQHDRIHSGEKKFRCSECPKSFGQSSTLQRHERIHSGEKPFLCGHCKKTFRHANTLKDHVKTQHSQIQGQGQGHTQQGNDMQRVPIINPFPMSSSPMQCPPHCVGTVDFSGRPFPAFPQTAQSVVPSPCVPQSICRNSLCLPLPLAGQMAKAPHIPSMAAFGELFDSQNAHSSLPAAHSATANFIFPHEETGGFDSPDCADCGDFSDADGHLEFLAAETDGFPSFISHSTLSTQSMDSQEMHNGHSEDFAHSEWRAF